MKRKLVLAAFFSTMAISGYAAAGGPGGCGGHFAGMNDPAKMAEHFAKMDTNGDGFISREEAQKNAPMLYVMFDAIDTNKDGQISKDEMTAFHTRMQEARTQGASTHQAQMQARMAEKFKAADKDGDGYLSKAEAEASMPRVAAHFAAIDTDGDGKISQAELQAYMASMPKRGPRGGGMGGGMAGGSM